jgi:type IV pilus assembly protein PilW
MSGARARSRVQAGVTLVELMVAMALGLLVAAGIVSVFLSTSDSHRVQSQMARLQEDGRFAVTRLARDLRMANAQYCTPSNAGGADEAPRRPSRVPVVYASGLMDVWSDLTTPWGSRPYPDRPSRPYSFPSFLRMRGYQCGKASCTPRAPDSLPPPGTMAGRRVVGADILTLRYLDASAGWALGGASTIGGTAEGLLHHISVVPGQGEPALADAYRAGDLLMLADCSLSQIFSANLQGHAFYPDAPETGLNLAMPVAPQRLSAPRLFDVNRDFHTVTYYLQVVDLGDGTTTGALMRRDNGEASEVVRGVERLDFLYAVEDADGGTRYLTASEVDSRDGGAIACPPGPPDAPDGGYGCLWGAVKSIEVHVLMSGQQVHGTLSANEQRYVYSIDGETEPRAPDHAGRAVTPAEQGFDHRMLRREFSALVSVRSYRP